MADVVTDRMIDKLFERFRELINKEAERQITSEEEKELIELEKEVINSDIIERKNALDLARAEKRQQDEYDKVMARKRGERLRAFRNELGYNQKKFADKLNDKAPSDRGCSRAPSTISNIENAKAGKEMTQKMAMDLGKAFGIRWEYFYCEDDFRTQKEYEEYISEKNKNEEKKKADEEKRIIAKKHIEELFAPHKLLKSALCAVLKQADYNINLERNVPVGYQWLDLDMETYKRHGVNEILGVTPETLKKLTEDIPDYSRGYWIEHEGKNVAWCPDAVLEQITEEIADIVKIRIQHFIEEQVIRRVRYEEQVKQREKYSSEQED